MIFLLKIARILWYNGFAYTYEQSINMGNAKYVYGISATPERENGHTPIIKMQCGDIKIQSW